MLKVVSLQSIATCCQDGSWFQLRQMYIVQLIIIVIVITET